MRLETASEADAQALQDRIHAHLIATDAGYAGSVQARQTLRWAFPLRETDESGNVKPGAKWFVFLKPRATGALTALEKAAVTPPGLVK